MYIRTKDKIYEVTNDKWGRNSVIEEDGVFKLHCEGASGVHWWAELLPLNQSENLEELCDLYIDEETQTIFHKHNGYVINWKTNMVYSLKALSESYHSVKGAIYTDKGLIYVAKMNDKGELCLL